MLQASHNTEPFAHALARRVLTQELPMRVIAGGDARRELASAVPRVASLAASFDMTQDDVTQVLRAQQMQLADDVRALFPNDSSMEHVSAQTEAKASTDSPPTPRHGER
jgi:hypothetical protein